MNVGESFAISATRAAPQAGHTLLAAVSQIWGAYEVQFQKAQRKPRRGRIHDLRRSLRTFNACLDLIEKTSPQAHVQKLKKSVKKTLSALSYLRDVQVQRKATRSEVPKNLRYKAFQKFLKEEEKRERRQARRVLAGKVLRAQRRVFRQVESELVVSVYSSKGDGVKFASDLNLAFQESVSRLRDLHQNLTPGNHRSFHRFRIQVKDVYYKTKILASMIQIPAPWIKRLDECRVQLGEMQDDFTFLNLSRGFLSKKKSPTGHPKRELDSRLVAKQKALLQKTRGLVSETLH